MVHACVNDRTIGPADMLANRPALPAQVVAAAQVGMQAHHSRPRRAGRAITKNRGQCGHYRG
jgi:hypothetical protein